MSIEVIIMTAVLTPVVCWFIFEAWVQCPWRDEE